ncbi:MAG: hypothetical protein ABH803_03385 [Candidatus Micrarchaeota archaeon]
MEINDFAKLNHERSVKFDLNKAFNWEYYAIAMGGECGELLNKLKKIKRGDFPVNKEELAEETVDVITYGFLLLSELGVDAEKVLMDKFEKVNKRVEKGGFHCRD